MISSKYRRRLVFLSCLGILAPMIWPQDSKPSEPEAMYYRYLGFASLVKGGAIQAHWMSDGSGFWYVEGAPDNTVIYKVDPKANKKEPLFDTPRLRQALTPVLGFEPPYKGLPFKEFSFVDGEKAVKFTVEGREFMCPLGTYGITATPMPSEEEKSRTTPRLVQKGFPSTGPDSFEVLSPDGRWFLGAKDANLTIRSTYDGRSEPLTTDGVKDDEWYSGAVKWAPDSFKVAAFKVNSQKVASVPLIHWLKTTEEVEWIRIPKAGGAMPLLELHIIDILSKKQVHVDTGDSADQYVALADWTPNGAELLLTIAARDWKKLELRAADPKTGTTRVILTETSKTFIGGLSKTHIPLLFEKGKKLIWLSERDGWAHLYLYDINGALIRQLTKGSFPVVRAVAVDEKGGWVYFTAHAESRLYDTHLYRVNLEGKGFERLTESSGQHEIQFSPSNEFFLDTHSTADRPPAVELRKAGGPLLLTVSKANVDALKDLKWSPPEEFVVKAADKKTDLYGVLFKPYNFDPKKTYPVLDDIYNGPYRTQAPRRFTDVVWPQAIAQLGFIVFLVDGRGTTERGKEFQDVVYGNFGRNEIPDHVAALKSLAEKRPYMDLTRAGIFGGSWGGYMTIRAMLLAPDDYKAGVSIAPVADLYDQNSLAIEYYVGLPQDNRESYEYGSSLRLAGNLKGKLLLIHGTSDVNATFSATMKMVEALIRAGKPFDLIVAPELNHSLSGLSGRYIQEAVRKYFQKHLLPEK